jgi:hypothetical protein
VLGHGGYFSKLVPRLQRCRKLCIFSGLSGVRACGVPSGIELMDLQRFPISLTGRPRLTTAASIGYFIPLAMICNPV